MSKLDGIRYDQGVGLAHADERRAIYDPLTILKGLDEERTWHQHKIMTIHKPLILGDHHHPYDEAFFCPSGGIDFLIADGDNPEEVKKYFLTRGQRLLVPMGLDHRAVGCPGSILMGWGTSPFDARNIIACTEEVKGVFDSYMDDLASLDN